MYPSELNLGDPSRPGSLILKGEMMQAYNKAIAALLTSLIMQAILAGLNYAGMSIPQEVNVALTSLVTTIAVYAVPNITKRVETIVEYIDPDPPVA